MDLGQLGLGVGQHARVALLLAELHHDLEVVEAAGELGEPVHLALERGEPAGDAGGVVLVVPQVRGRDLLAEVRDLAAHGRDVEHLLDGAHGRAELLDLGVEVGSCHEAEATARDSGVPIPDAGAAASPMRSGQKLQSTCGVPTAPMPPLVVAAPMVSRKTLVTSKATGADWVSAKEPAYLQ